MVGTLSETNSPGVPTSSPIMASNDNKIMEPTESSTDQAQELEALVSDKDEVTKLGVETDTVTTEDMAKLSGHTAELGATAAGKDGEYVKPMNPLVWKLMITTLVLLYGSYSVLVHMCEKNGKLTFSSASYVFVVEMSKFAISVAMYLVESRGSGFQMPSLRLALYYSVPGILYFINNNLSIHLQEEMDPATYQILSNLKILSTALLYRIIIKRPITYLQWFSLAILASAGALSSYGGLVARVGEHAVSLAFITKRGLEMVAVYCFISGLAGVYSEWILKDKYQMSIHIQNGMLYVFGMILNGSAWFYGAATSSDKDSFNLFKGYTFITVILVLNQAVCGLLMSSVMKHGNNIIRLFVISGAMVIAIILSVIVFGLKLNIYIIGSGILVTVAVGLYHKK